MVEANAIKAEANFNTRADSLVKLGGVTNHFNSQNPISQNAVRPYIGDLSTEILAEFIGDKDFLSREDMIESVIRGLFPPKGYKKVIQIMKGYLNPEDLSYLVSSSMICSKEDDGLDSEKDLENIRHTKQGSRALTIYNWLRSGETFQQDFLPCISARERVISEKLNGNEREFIKYFKREWEAMIIRHPKRIFVKRDMTVEDLSQEILNRVFTQTGKSSVYVYSRRTRNWIAKKAIGECMFHLRKLGLRVKPLEYNIGKFPAMRFKVFRQLKKTGFPKKAFFYNRMNKNNISVKS